MEKSEHASASCADIILCQGRLENIEKKLNELQSLMVTIARVEERLSNHLNGVHRLFKKIDAHEDRIIALEKAVADNSRLSRAVERLGWMVVTLVFSVAGYSIKNFWE